MLCCLWYVSAKSPVSTELGTVGRLHRGEGVGNSSGPIFLSPNNRRGASREIKCAPTCSSPEARVHSPSRSVHSRSLAFCPLPIPAETRADANRHEQTRVIRVSKFLGLWRRCRFLAIGYWPLAIPVRFCSYSFTLHNPQASSHFHDLLPFWCYVSAFSLPLSGLPRLRWMESSLFQRPITGTSQR